MNSNLYKIDHIVVLVLENRSFDNMLGRLYAPCNKPPFHKVPYNQPFEGVWGKNLFNPIPEGEEGSDRKIVPSGKETVMTNPNPNPEFGYYNTFIQLYGETCKPYNALSPQKLPDRATMNGFVKDYISVLKKGKYPCNYKDYKIIMDGYTPEEVPVISTLAMSYAVCDQWYSSVPSETFTNRSFINSATSCGVVNNTPYTSWLKNDADTIFNRIEDMHDKRLTWRVYYDRGNILPFTWLLHTKLRPYIWSNFFGMKQFQEDAKNGELPSYSFIEPRVFFNHNDQHPPIRPHIIASNVLAGELLIYKVYEAVSKGRNWDKTLLIITYDEHGGCFDHMPPPKAVPPEKNAPPGQFGFRFDRLGVRVPSVLVSPYIAPGTVYRAKDNFGRTIPLDHCSIIKTLTNRWGLINLTERDKAAEDVSDVLTLSKPRTDIPSIMPRPYNPLSALKEELISKL